MPVDRCVCFNITLAELKASAAAHGDGLDGLQRRHLCGRGCGLCLPYIRAMLRTGRTSFDVDDPDVFDGRDEQRPSEPRPSGSIP